VPSDWALAHKHRSHAPTHAARTPHDLARAPHSLARTPHDLARAPYDLALAPQRSPLALDDRASVHAHLFHARRVPAPARGAAAVARGPAAARSANITPGMTKQFSSHRLNGLPRYSRRGQRLHEEPFIMSFQPYLPRSEAERIVWLTNYAAKLPTLGPLCKLDADEIAATLSDIACALWLLQSWNPAMQQGAQSATALKTLVINGNGSGSGNTPPSLPVIPTFPNPPPMCLPGVLPRLANQVARIKISPHYTDAIGRDLRIVGTSEALAETHTVPDLSARLEQGDGQQCVVLNYTKHGHAGAQIESRRNGSAWEFLAINVVKPHIDERPLLVADTPEVREYRMRYWNKGQASGDFSQVVKVTVSA
jgi:hypothetical protein